MPRVKPPCSSPADAGRCSGTAFRRLLPARRAWSKTDGVPEMWPPRPCSRDLHSCWSSPSWSTPFSSVAVEILVISSCSGMGSTRCASTSAVVTSSQNQLDFYVVEHQLAGDRDEPRP